MPAPLFDFVDALSAEARCPVCKEPHAAVDQHACGRCGTAICPDCASLSPDASWICEPCVRQEPPRAFPPRELSAWSALRARQAGLTVRGALFARALAPLAVESRDRLRAFAVARARALAALLLALWTELARAAAPRAQRALARLDLRLRAHRRRVSSSFRRDRLIAQRALERWLDEAALRARWNVSRFVLSIRNVSVREQLLAMLLGTAIMVAVARSDRRPSR